MTIITINNSTYHKKGYVGIGQTTSRHTATAYQSEDYAKTVAKNLNKKYEGFRFETEDY